MCVFVPRHPEHSYHRKLETLRGAHYNDKNKVEKHFWDLDNMIEGSEPFIL